MPKGRKRKQGKRKPTEAVRDFARPTPEREAKNRFQSAGMAKRVIPPIVRLHASEALTDEEYAALAYYRDQASLADKSPMRSCIDFSARGDRGPGVAIQSAIRETHRIEQNMGALWTVCRAICVDDVTPEQWCEDRYGNTDKVGITVLELKYAAGGIVR